jgi:hypothetical protein
MNYICRRVELGRHGRVPETMVKWEGHPIPTPYMYFRTSSMVAYAEVCAPDNLGDEAWSEVLKCAGSAGIAAGIATIIAGPASALPVFESAFKSCLAGKVGELVQKIQVSLSTSQQPNEDWHR